MCSSYVTKEQKPKINVFPRALNLDLGTCCLCQGRLYAASVVVDLSFTDEKLSFYLLKAPQQKPLVEQQHSKPSKSGSPWGRASFPEHRKKPDCSNKVEKKTRRIHVQAKIISHVSWSCYGFLDLLRLFLTLESRVLAHENEKSMGKMSLQCRVGLALVPVAFQRLLPWAR